MVGKLIQWYNHEREDYKHLLRSVPSSVVTLLVVSVVLMNLLANKEIYTGRDWLALDCGLLLSWLSFLCMDIITRRFGPKAAIKLSALALGVNLFVCVILYLISLIPGNWSTYYTYNDVVVNNALNDTIGGTWYILLGSTVAMAVASVVNALSNAAIGKLYEHNNFASYAIRSYVSTFLGQFVDNMIFALLVSHQFFGWSWVQCVTCSLTGCLMELFFEVIFSPYGYRVSKEWEKDGVGDSYLEKFARSHNED